MTRWTQAVIYSPSARASAMVTSPTGLAAAWKRLETPESLSSASHTPRHQWRPTYSHSNHGRCRKRRPREVRSPAPGPTPQGSPCPCEVSCVDSCRGGRREGKMSTHLIAGAWIPFRGLQGSRGWSQGRVDLWVLIPLSFLASRSQLEGYLVREPLLHH